MALYLRLLGNDPDNPKIPIHTFQACAAEWARGNITGAQANTAIGLAVSVDDPKPLTASEQVEAQTLVSTITSIAISGTAVQQADARARRALRMFEIDQVLMLVDSKLPPYNTEAAIKARLGV